METLKIGMREFRDKLAAYLLESEAPLVLDAEGISEEEAVADFLAAASRGTGLVI